MDGGNLHPLLDLKKLSALKEALYFLHVDELVNFSLKFSLPSKGTKKDLIHSILHFIETGAVQQEAKIPKASCKEKGKSYPLAPDTLVLKGAYKNDLVTRVFFKKLIGTHFHFTAFGIDWIKEQWLAGNPPTYGEFAKMWQEGYTRRQQHGSQPKQEWAYINFVQKFLSTHPKSSKATILIAWEQERTKHLEIAQQVLGDLEKLFGRR